MSAQGNNDCSSVPEECRISISELPEAETLLSLDELIILRDGSDTLRSKINVILNAASVPTGTVSAFAGSAAPAGYLLCDGSPVNRTTYADLFGVIDETYGVGDGSTTFNLPDLRGRVIAGQDDMGGSSAGRITTAKSGIDGGNLGEAGGSEEHLLVQEEIPGHTHYAVKVNTTPLDDYLTAGDEVLASGGPASNINERYSLTETAEGDPDTAITSSTGGDQAHRNVQPTIILNYIIKV